MLLPVSVVEHSLRLAERTHLWVDNLCDKVVRFHSLAPVAQTGDSLGRLHRARVVEVRSVEVRVEELACLVVDLFLGERKQRVEEVISHHGHGDVLPVLGRVDDNLTLLRLVPRNLFGHGVLPQHQYSVENALDKVGRVLKSLGVLDGLLVD